MNYREMVFDLESLPSADPSNIVIKDDFVSKEHLAKIMDYCASIKEWESQSDLGTDSIHVPELIERNSPEVFSIMQQYVNNVQH